MDTLEYLVRTKRLTNIKDYCMTNEICLDAGPYGALKGDLPRFKSYHQAIFDELKARKLEIRLLATDASPISAWDTIDWATKNMDEITGVYGGHEYIGEYALDDERFYPWFLSKMQWGAGMARSRGKDFILGEFGCKQAPPGTTVGGKEMDSCIYFGTPQEPHGRDPTRRGGHRRHQRRHLCAGLLDLRRLSRQLRQSGGVPTGNTYANKWGVFKWSGGDNSTRDHYYAYGLLTNFSAARRRPTRSRSTIRDCGWRRSSTRAPGRGRWPWSTATAARRRSR